MPALVQVRNASDGQELLVDLCILHLTLAPKAVKEMHTLRHEDELARLTEENIDVEKET
jgi:hypothetical protein